MEPELLTISRNYIKAPWNTQRASRQAPGSIITQPTRNLRLTRNLVSSLLSTYYFLDRHLRKTHHTEVELITLQLVSEAVPGHGVVGRVAASGRSHHSWSPPPSRQTPPHCCQTPNTATCHAGRGVGRVLCCIILAIVVTPLVNKLPVFT